MKQRVRLGGSYRSDGGKPERVEHTAPAPTGKPPAGAATRPAPRKPKTKD